MSHYECNTCGAFPDACSCEAEEQKKRDQATKRKQAQRDKEAALDIKEVRVMLSASERENLDKLCSVRAGRSEPYTRSDYIKILLVADNRRLKAQFIELEQQGPCTKCKSSLPGGCEGMFKGEEVCWFHPSKKRLELC